MGNEDVAFVQSPQSYSNTDNFIAHGTSTAQEIFYNYVQPAKNSSNSAFCVGTNVLFRRKAIDEIGGMFELDHSEDIWTSLMLHEKGWKSIYTTRVLAIGQAPETIISFLKQQKRWAQGGFTIFFSNNPILSSKLRFDQKTQYLYSSLFYFVGISITIYLILPILFLLFGISSIRLTDSNEWIFRYVPYLVIFYLLPVLLTGKITLSAVSTSIATFSAYVSALLNTIISKRYVWITTTSKKSSSGQLLQYVWPHILIISLSISSAVLGWFAVTDVVITGINSFWALLNASLLAIFLVKGFESPKESLSKLPENTSKVTLRKAMKV
jgi:cellulose synthase (UDP-forming)